jgi:tetratricopeptide (TPR) repeat protein
MSCHGAVRVVVILGLGVWALTALASFLVSGGSSEAYHYSGLEALSRKDFRAGGTLIRSAVRVNPQNVLARLRLASLLSLEGSHKAALQELRLAQQQNPENAEAAVRLAQALLESGELAEGEALARRAQELAPEHPQAAFVLGQLLSKQGKLDSSIQAHRESLGIRPYTAPGHVQLAILLLMGGKVGEALDHYRTALRVQPDDVDVLMLLAWTLATEEDPRYGNGAESLELAQRACRLTDFRYAPALDVLAAALADTGEFAEAVDRAQAAQQLAQASGQEALAGRIQQRGQLYAKKQPYRDRREDFPEPWREAVLDKAILSSIARKPAGR